MYPILLHLEFRLVLISFSIFWRGPLTKPCDGGAMSRLLGTANDGGEEKDIGMVLDRDETIERLADLVGSGLSNIIRDRVNIVRELDQVNTSGALSSKELLFMTRRGRCPCSYVSFSALPGTRHCRQSGEAALVLHVEAFTTKLAGSRSPFLKSLYCASRSGLTFQRFRRDSRPIPTKLSMVPQGRSRSTCLG